MVVAKMRGMEGDTTTTSEYKVRWERERERGRKDNNADRREETAKTTSERTKKHKKTSKKRNTHCNNLDGTKRLRKLYGKNDPRFTSTVEELVVVARCCSS